MLGNTHGCVTQIRPPLAKPEPFTLNWEDMLFAPLRERRKVESEWTKVLSMISDKGGTNTELPHPYFIDHYGYLLHLDRPNSVENGISKLFYACHLPNAKTSWRDRVEQFVCSCSAWDAHTQPKLAEQVPQHPITTELLGLWSNWLLNLGIRLPATYYTLPDDITWGDFFMDSVHFPDRPAIAGPTFFFRITTEQQEQLIRRYGSQAPTALYIVLVRIHEKSHFLQTGCPLINELSLSALWGNFLTDFDQWLWQANSDTQTPFNLEWEHTKCVPLHPEQWAQIFTDSYLGIESLLGTEAQKIYDNLSKHSFDFFLRKSGYKKYVEISCALLTEALVR